VILLQETLMSTVEDETPTFIYSCHYYSHIIPPVTINVW
jgi:hypothetical protein